jgi:hypothetical protein
MAYLTRWIIGHFVQRKVFDICKDETYFVEISPTHSLYVVPLSAPRPRESNPIPCVFFLPVTLKLNSNRGSLIFYVSRSHTIPHTHTHNRNDSSKHAISPSQMPLPTHYTTHTRDEYHAVSGIRTRVPSNRGVAYLHVKLHDNRDRRKILKWWHYKTRAPRHEAGSTVTMQLNAL